MSQATRCPTCQGPLANRRARQCRKCHESGQRSVVRVCSVENCGRRHAARGLCQLHWHRQRRGMALDAPLRGRTPYKRYVTVCPVAGCERVTFYALSGWCSMHGDRMRRSGSVGPVQSTRRPNGAWTPWQVDRFGYVRRRENGRWITQHRVVMEQKLGRPLLSSENVHHKNGDRADNCPENLELWSSFQPPGQRVADKLAWARRIVELYGDLSEELLA